MNTSDLVAKIAEANSVSKAQAQAIVDSMLNSIMSAAARRDFASRIWKVQSQGNART
jgi:nucleoid DNA-binding protein